MCVVLMFCTHHPPKELNIPTSCTENICFHADWPTGHVTELLCVFAPLSGEKQYLRAITTFWNCLVTHVAPL